VTIDGVWIDNWIYYTRTLKYNWVSPDSLSLTTDNWVLTESLLWTLYSSNSELNSATTATTQLASLANIILVTVELNCQLKTQDSSQSQSHVTTDNQ
jgi:hypothetical protein